MERDENNADFGTRLFVEKVVDLLLHSPSHETRNNIVMMIENDKNLQQTFVAEFERRLKSLTPRSPFISNNSCTPGQNSKHNTSQLIADLSSLSSTFHDFIEKSPTLKIPKEENFSDVDSSCSSAKAKDDLSLNPSVYQGAQQLEIMQGQLQRFPNCQVTCTVGNKVNDAFSTTSTYIESEFIDQPPPRISETGPVDTMSRVKEGGTDEVTSQEFSISNNVIPLLTSYSVQEFSDDGFGGNYFLY